MQLCECGCGQPAPLARWTDKRWGHVKGEPVRYIRGHIGRGPTLPPGWRENEITGCWLWTGRIRASDGRPMWSDRLAHRRVYEQHMGEIERGHELHHVCEHIVCVNPRHMRPLTPAEHTRLHRSGELA